MDKVLKWAGALFVASACGVLSAFSFQGWESHGGSTNKVIAMLLALQNFLVCLLGRHSDRAAVRGMCHCSSGARLAAPGRWPEIVRCLRLRSQAIVDCSMEARHIRAVGIVLNSESPDVEGEVPWKK